jgi:hypothetical protein
MKYLYPALFVALLSSCSKPKFTEITGTVTGFDNGTMMIRDENGNTKYSENIEGVKFHFKKILDATGYYRLKIIDNTPRESQITGYDVFLEPGDYTISAQPEKAHQYPDIKSSSPTQTEISNYYEIANAKTLPLSPGIEKYVDAINSGKLSNDEKLNESSELNEILAQRDSAMGAALQVFVNKYPKNDIAAHLMYQLNYERAPELYYPIYKKFTDKEKNSIEGAAEGDKLEKLSKLISGALAPPIVGKTLDGKKFDPKALNKKVILVEFWRSDDGVSSGNHFNLINGVRSPLKNKDFTMVSVSLDIEFGVWNNAVIDQHLKWTQVCDLKGEDSPNVANWQIKSIPTYYLVDGNWKIIKRNIYLGDVPAAMKKYLAANQ